MESVRKQIDFFVFLFFGDPGWFFVTCVIVCLVFCFLHFLKNKPGQNSVVGVGWLAGWGCLAGWVAGWDWVAVAGWPAVWLGFHFRLDFFRENPKNKKKQKNNYTCDKKQIKIAKK